VSTRRIFVDIEVELTPVFGRPSVDSIRGAQSALGLATAIGILQREAARKERLADRNARAGKENGAASKRYTASRLHAATDLLLKLAIQIDAQRHIKQGATP
jgi:hypothetical protein